MFGSANQLLGALALLTVTVWLHNKGVNPLFTLIPMVFMFTVTISSLVIFAWKNFQSGSITLTVLSVALLGLSFALIILARKSLSGVLSGTRNLTSELEE
jgi:carbon starvation protein